MKKLNLSIPTPCHENWDEMSQAEKGKFCGACQKTVIDFTAMTDRQLADFFKKPKADVCGRFNNDQLQREILIPRKRIPWIRYFFQFTWPAFVLALKSCNNNSLEKTTGVLSIESSPKSIETFTAEMDTIKFATLGFVAPEIVPFEEIKTITCYEEIKTTGCKDASIWGDVIKTSDSTESEEDTIQTGRLLDPVTVVAYPTTIGRVIMGGISSQVVKTNDTVDSISQTSKVKEENSLAYPNPVSAGSMLTVTFPENNIPEKIQLISISGQIIATIDQDISDYATMCNIRIPSHVAAGVYFLRLFSKNKILNTIKIVVNK